MNVLHIDHTAIVVHDLDEAVARYQRLFNVRAGQRHTITEQGVEVVFLQLADGQIELIRPLDRSSGVGRFLERGGEGLHHIAVLVEDIGREIACLREQGVEMIDQEPRRGPHGLVAFVHPRGTGGVLVELVEHAAEDYLQA